MHTPKVMVRTIGNEIEAMSQIKDILKKYGLTSARYAGGVIKNGSFVVKIEFFTEQEEAQGIQLVGQVSASSFGSKSKFAQHGLPEDIIGKTVRLANRMFTIVDVKPQNAQGSLKKCVVIEGAGGGKYVTTASDIKRALGIKETASTLTEIPANTLVRRPVPGQELSADLSAKFESLSARLSPENLSCDGECSKLEISRRYNAIMGEWRELEKLAGRKVSQNEFPH